MWTLLACFTAPSPAEPPVPPPSPVSSTATVYQDLATATASLRKPGLKIIGVGELHARTDVVTKTSTMSRFTNEILPVLAPGNTDLVLETWRVNSECRTTASAVATTVQVETKRPEEVKDEMTLLIEAAKKLQLSVHDLPFSCDEWKGIRDEAGEVDYGRLLQAVRQKLLVFGEEALKREDVGLILYGGAAHNDLAPPPDREAVAYGKALHEAAPDRYLELDLYEVASLRQTPSMMEESWSAEVDRFVAGTVVVIQRKPASWIILF